MINNEDRGLETGFSRTTSNSFITSQQYAQLETAPVESDRRVLEAIKQFLTHRRCETTSRDISVMDPLVTTIKDPQQLGICRQYVMDTILHKYQIRSSVKPVPSLSKLPKKAKIQLENIIRRLRGPENALRQGESIEIQVAWHLRQLLMTGSTPLHWMSSLLFFQRHAFPTMPIVQETLEKTIHPRAEEVWDTLLENEHVLWNQRRFSVDLYENQVELLRAMELSQVLVELASPPCTGKTVMAAGLLMACPSSTLVFCCVSPGVYLHVARLLFHLGIYPTFVFGNHKIEPNFKISRVSWDPRSLNSASNYLEKVIPKARAFIVDLNLCQWFLGVLRRPEAILFLDEPTMGADGCEAFAHVPRLLAGILQSSSLPQKVVLSSATLPSTQDLEPLRRPWSRLYPEGKHVRISKAILTSSISLIQAHTGKLVLPHYQCRSADEIHHVMDRIEQDVVLLKAYSGIGVKTMRQAYETVYGVSAPTFASAGFHVPHDISLLNIRRYAHYMLGLVARDFREEFVSYSSTFFPPLCLENMALDFSPFVPGQTLIVSVTSTEKLARSLVDPLIAHRKARHLEVALSSRDHQSKQAEAQAQKIKDPKEREMYQESQEYNVPITLVPEELVIHSVAHLRKYGGHDVMRRFPRNFVRMSPASSIVRKILDTNSEEWLKLSYLTGVTYSDVRFHTQTSPLIQMMEDSLQDGIPIAVVDTSFTYGVNTPASSVVVTEEAAESMSRNSLLQYTNRVARGCGTHFGKAFLSDLALKKLLGEDDRREAEALAQAMIT